eukprot:CAMPEP_0197434190 /NCGR_PEP_ID=MMETSP1175-20131217/1957_1 /TAXON_ID=1003142 /ORGANISM="Triceratium dubium, Strain CCMP147" /LENGTH=94 /DNA_ID=CAMNT_0042962817 /DNA_START=120 /DNA_END=401 /DNA_ORIENTATION=-
MVDFFNEGAEPGKLLFLANGGDFRPPPPMGAGLDMIIDRKRGSSPLALEVTAAAPSVLAGTTGAATQLESLVNRSVSSSRVVWMRASCRECQTG